MISVNNNNNNNNNILLIIIIIFVNNNNNNNNNNITLATLFQSKSISKAQAQAHHHHNPFIWEDIDFHQLAWAGLPLKPKPNTMGKPKSTNNPQSPNLVKPKKTTSSSSQLPLPYAWLQHRQPPHRGGSGDATVSEQLPENGSWRASPSRRIHVLLLLLGYRGFMHARGGGVAMCRGLHARAKKR